MIIPVRCFTCGAVVGNLSEPFTTLTSTKGLTNAIALNNLLVKKPCCRRHLLTSVDLISVIDKIVEKEDK
jgi:DNA-directed RNA polymerase subunit N (RpoN/RPB10)